MKRKLLTICLSLACGLVQAQTSGAERLSSIGRWSMIYNTEILGNYDSVQYSYPDHFHGGGPEQSYDVTHLSSTYFSKLQYYRYDKALGLIPWVSSAIQRIPSENKIVLSTIDYDQSTFSILYHSADSILEFDAHGNLIMYRNLFYSDSGLLTNTRDHPYVYNNQNQLIADTLFKMIKAGSQPKLLNYYTYEYDDKGRCSSKAEYNTTGDTTKSTVYTYDELSRVISVEEFNSFNSKATGYYYDYDDLNHTQTTDYIGYAWDDTNFAYRTLVSHFSDRNETSKFHLNNGEWIIESITTDMLNPMGLVVEESYNEYRDTLMPNGTHWQITTDVTYQYNEWNHLISSNSKFYHMFYDSLITIEKSTYHWEPYITSSEDEPFTIQCSPIPCNENLTVTYEAKDEGPCEISLLNTLGTKMLNQQVHAKVGLNQVVLNMEGFSVGNYIVFLQIGKQRNSTKILKQ